ncbi:hypothetical protein FOA52_006554 [Chlamydomonas sp. UWO 241]|nr:hypothetical protein FOA52_006554 [Chlamydomonas sp. UWO 241]
MEAAPKVLALLAQSPDAAKVADARGRLPLHAVTARQAAPAVVKALLKAHLEGAAATDKKGWLPLHSAAASKAPPEVVAALLVAYPEGASKKDAEGMLPLHCAALSQAPHAVVKALLQALEVVTMLLDAHKAGAAVASKGGRLPLHRATANKAPIAVVEALLEAHPEGVQAVDAAGMLPLHCAVTNKSQPEIVIALLKAHPEGAARKDNNCRLPLHAAAAKQAPLEVVAPLLAKFAAGARARDKWQKLPLQVAVTHMARPDIVAALLAAHPNDAGPALQAASSQGRPWRESFAAAVACSARDGDPRAWHEVVKVETFAPQVAALVAADHSLATLEDNAGYTAMDVAVWAARWWWAPEAVGVAPEAVRMTPEAAPEVIVGAPQAMIKACAFLGRYQIDRAVHTSETCTVLLGRDLAVRPALVRFSKSSGAPEALCIQLWRSQVLARVKYKLDTRYVVGVLRVHIAPSESDSSGDSAAKELLQKCRREGVAGDVHGSFSSTYAQYHLCVVMPRGDRSLQDAMLHEHFAGADWHLIKSIGKGVLTALKHMHEQSLVHGDVKPLNVMRVALSDTASAAAGSVPVVAGSASAGSIWRLIDLDVSRKIGQTFGDKAPSSGYCAPELAKAMLAASAGATRGAGWQLLRASRRAGSLRPLPRGALSSLRASVACDLWSFGVMLFLLGAACPLLPMDLNDNLSADDLAKLANWERRDLNKRLREVDLPSHNGVLVDLLTKLLEADPVERLKHWAPKWEGEEASGVLQHPLFNPNTRMDEVNLSCCMDAILNGQERIEAKLDQLQAQARMLSSLFSGDRAVPSLLCLVPVDAAGLSWWKLADPSQWLQKEVLLYFVDPISLEFDPSSGFRLTFTKEWVRKVIPYVKRQEGLELSEEEAEDSHAEEVEEEWEEGEEGMVQMAVADAAGALVVTPAEVRAAATHSKPGTAPGPDGIPVDVWRKLGEPAFELLAAVFTAVGATGGTPPGFLDGVVASIYKAKNAADAANYRPLTMLGSDYRILAKVLATRWTPLLSAVVGPEQTAFLAGRRISDNICLTQMLPGLLAANAAEGVGPTGAALALLDFRKAYDTIDRGFLIAVMEAVGVGDGVLAWTRTILTHTYASAEVNGFISAPRKYAAGVRQGCPAAPALFLFLGHALACFLRTCPAVGVEVVPGCRVTCPQYADDCMPLLRSCAPADVAALVETMAVFGRATGLVLNLGKCGILPLGSAGEGLLAVHLPSQPATMVDDKLVKAAIKEGGKKGVDLDGVCAMGGVMFFNIAVDVPNGDFELLEKVMEGSNLEVDEEAEERKGGAGAIGKMFASAGDDQLACMVHVPKAIAEKLSLKLWVDTCCNSVGGEIVEMGEEFAKWKAVANPEAGRFPLKMRDEAIAAGIALFKEKGLVPLGGDSSDDVNYADAAGVEW